MDINQEVQTLQKDIGDIKTQVGELKKQVADITHLHDVVINIEKTIQKVSETADQIFSKLAGSLTEKGLIFRQSDLEVKVVQLEGKLNTITDTIDAKDLKAKVTQLWEDRLKLLGASGVISIVAVVLYEVIKHYIFKS